MSSFLSDSIGRKPFKTRKDQGLFEKITGKSLGATFFPKTHVSKYGRYISPEEIKKVQADRERERVRVSEWEGDREMEIEWENERKRVLAKKLEDKLIESKLESAVKIPNNSKEINSLFHQYPNNIKNSLLGSAIKVPDNAVNIKTIIENIPLSHYDAEYLYYACTIPNNYENIKALLKSRKYFLNVLDIQVPPKKNQILNLIPKILMIPNNAENIKALIDGGLILNQIDMSRIHATNRDIIEKEKIYQSRKPYLQMVEGTPESQGDIANYLSNEIIMRNISQYMNPDKGGKKTKKRQNHQKTKKSKKRKSVKSCKRKTRK